MQIFWLTLIIIMSVAFLYLGKTILHSIRERPARSVPAGQVTLDNLANILNNLNAMVCITDPDTNELLFINDNMKKALEVEDDWAGHKCHRVLRHFDERCTFCPCDKLNQAPDKEVIWEQNHVHTSRVYRTYSRYISWIGGKTVHLQQAVDITDLRDMTIKLDKQLAKRLEQQSLMTHISQSFLSDEDMEVLITDALRNVGEFMGIAQINLYRAESDEHTFICRNGWTNPEYDELSCIDSTVVISEPLFYLLKKHRDQEQFYISSNDSDEENAMAMWRKKSHNFLCAGIFFGSKLHAILEFSQKKNIKWTQDKINMASFVLNILTGVLQKHTVDEQLIQAKEFAEQSSKFKSDFLAKMSHEIRTPMNAILGITEIQLRNETLSSDMKEALSQVYESGNLLLNIINDILDMSKIEVGKLEITPVKYDFPSLISDTVQLNRLRYENKPIDFCLDVDENTPLNLFGDEFRIKQVLNNILSNAFKYTEEGKIMMSVVVEPTDREESIMLIFRISDTGQGMTADQVNKLFDEFTRFNREVNRDIIGTGLGMSITKRLLDLMEGDVFVESEVGKGSVFTVRLPQECFDTTVCGSELADKLSHFCYKSRLKKSHITREHMPYGSVLVVDDLKTNIYVAKNMLSPYKLQIDTASSGFEAVEKIKNGNVYDIIFMDHMMPKMNGIETVRIIRNMGYSHSIVALTASALVGHEEMFLQEGFDGYLSKPIDSHKLDSILNEFILHSKHKLQVERIDSA